MRRSAIVLVVVGLLLALGCAGTLQPGPERGTPRLSGLLSLEVPRPVIVYSRLREDVRAEDGSHDYHTPNPVSPVTTGAHTVMVDLDSLTWRDDLLRAGGGVAYRLNERHLTLMLLGFNGPELGGLLNIRLEFGERTRDGLTSLLGGAAAVEVTGSEFGRDVRSRQGTASPTTTTRLIPVTGSIRRGGRIRILP